MPKIAIRGVTDNHRWAVALLSTFTLIFLAVMLFITRLGLPLDVASSIKDAFLLFEGALLTALKTDSTPKDPSFRPESDTQAEPDHKQVD